jgi:hypothetical protein
LLASWFSQTDISVGCVPKRDQHSRSVSWDALRAVLAQAVPRFRRDTELIAFAPGGEQRDRWEGVRSTFVERGSERLLVLDELEVACEPAG